MALSVQEKKYELDVLIFATGYQACEGCYNAIDFTGRDGKKLKEAWKDGPRSFSGAFNPGFPNLAMLFGPAAPFANVPPLAEKQTNFVASVIEAANGQTIEASEQAQEEWMRVCKEFSDAVVFSKVESWITGKNVGKKDVVQFYMGGNPNYDAVRFFIAGVLY